MGVINKVGLELRLKGGERGGAKQLRKVLNLQKQVAGLYHEPNSLAHCHKENEPAGALRKEDTFVDFVNKAMIEVSRTIS